MTNRENLFNFVRDELLSLVPSEPLDETTNLLKLGLDSLKMMRLIAFVEESYEISIPDEEVNPTTFNTLKRILELVEETKASKK